MDKLKNTDLCLHICESGEYIACIGRRISVYRQDLQFYHQFTGLRNLGRGEFLNDDILFLTTTDDRVYFLSMQEKRCIWEPKRPDSIAAVGDVSFCIDRAKMSAICICAGKKDRSQRFLVVYHFPSREIAVREIPDCCSVITNLDLRDDGSVSFLHFHSADGNGKLLCRITNCRFEPTIRFETTDEWISDRVPGYLWKNSVILKDYRSDRSQLVIQNGADENEIPLSAWVYDLPTDGNPWTKEPGKTMLPRTLGPTEDSQMLLAVADYGLFLIDPENAAISELCKDSGILCGLVSKGRTLLGTASGVMVV